MLFLILISEIVAETSSNAERLVLEMFVET